MSAAGCDIALSAEQEHRHEKAAQHQLNAESGEGRSWNHPPQRTLVIERPETGRLPLRDGDDEKREPCDGRHATGNEAPFQGYNAPEPADALIRRQQTRID